MSPLCRAIGHLVGNLLATQAEVAGELGKNCAPGLVSTRMAGAVDGSA